MREGHPTTKGEPRRPVWLSALIVFNIALLVGLFSVSIGPLRSALGAATGIWHDCEIRSPGGSGTDGWNRPLLLVLVPFGIGIWLGAWSWGVFDTPYYSRTPARGSPLLITISIIGVIWTLIMWFVPTSTCIA